MSYSHSSSNPTGRRLSPREIRRIAEDVTVKFDLVKTHGEGSASGFVISADEHVAWILTNRHVVIDLDVGRSSIYYAPTGQRARFRVLDIIPEGADLAIVESSMHFLEMPRISSRKHLSRGEPIYMFGYPGGRPEHATGKFKYRQNDERYYRRYADSKYIEVCDITSEPGSSGSAILDVYGEVVGVMSKGFDAHTSPCFIVPVPYVRKMLRDNSLDFIGPGQGDCEVEYVGRRWCSDPEDASPRANRRTIAYHGGLIPCRRGPIEYGDRDYGVQRSHCRRDPPRRHRRQSRSEPVFCCALM